MLVLSRRAGEGIRIGPDVEIRVLQVRGSGPSGVVRVGVVAPPHVKVLRSEVWEAVLEENRRAATSVPGHLVQAAEALAGVVSVGASGLESPVGRHDEEPEADGTPSKENRGGQSALESD